MQLTKQDVVSMVGVIKANYDNAYKNSTKDTLLAMIEQWYKSLVVYEKEIVGVAFQRALEECEYPPNLANIMKQIKTIKEATEPTDAEYWVQLSDTLRRVASCVYKFQFNAREDNGLTQGQNARNKVKEIWEQLPQILKDYCGSENGLINLSRMDQDELAFEKGRFIKMLPTLKTRIEVKQTIDAGVLALASGTPEKIDLLPLLDTENKK